MPQNDLDIHPKEPVSSHRVTNPCVFLLLALHRSLAALLVSLPVIRLAFLGAIARLLALSTELEFLTFSQLVLRLPTEFVAAAIGIEVVRGAVVLVMGEGCLHLVFGVPAKVGVVEWHGGSADADLRNGRLEDVDVPGG